MNINQLNEFVTINPKEELHKGQQVKKISMDKLTPFSRKITGYEYTINKNGSKFRNRDTIMAKITPCLENGKTAFVDILDEDEIAIGSTEFIVLRAKENLNDIFLYYFSISPIFRKRAIESMEGTSGRKRVNETSLGNSCFHIPELPTQLRIANILGSIDDKIEVNRKKIEKLEAIAKLIYEHWFVQFDFPNEEGKPYKSSGGEMVYDKTLKRDIPKGWKVKSLSELISLTRGVIYSSTDEESSDGIDVVEIYRGNNICNGHIIEDENRVFIPRKKVSPAQYLDDFSIFITMSSGSKAHVGKVAISYNSKEKSYGGFCSKIVPDKEYRNIVFGFFASDLYRTWIESICSGTGINNLRDDHFDLIKLSIPINSEFLKKYAFYTNSLFKKIQNIVKETDSLCKLRDFLLPMLMNGQVEIAD